MTFTNQQRDAVAAGETVPITIDGIQCVVLRADKYQQVQGVLSDDLDHNELRQILARSCEGSDWLDSSMDIYDDYDKYRCDAAQ